MSSDVFYFTARTHSYEQSMSKFKGIIGLQKLGFNQKIKNGNKVVIKTHFGALENIRYLRPSYIRFLCDYVKEVGGIPSVAVILGDFSNGNDAILVRNNLSIEQLKGKRVSLVEYSVSHYLLSRALDKSGLKDADVKVINVSDMLLL